MQDILVRRKPDKAILVTGGLQQCKYVIKKIERFPFHIKSLTNPTKLVTT